MTNATTTINGTNVNTETANAGDIFNIANLYETILEEKISEEAVELLFSMAEKNVLPSLMSAGTLMLAIKTADIMEVQKSNKTVSDIVGVLKGKISMEETFTSMEILEEAIENCGLPFPTFTSMVKAAGFCMA